MGGGGSTQTHRQKGDLISLLLFLHSKESKLKSKTSNDEAVSSGIFIPFPGHPWAGSKSVGGRGGHRHKYGTALVAVTTWSVRRFRLSPARVEDAGNTDRQANPKPSETVLVAHSRVIDPNFISISIITAPQETRRQKVKTKKENAFKNSQRLKRAPWSCVLVACLLRVYPRWCYLKNSLQSFVIPKKALPLVYWRK
jgi:hypothetical protein